MGDDDREPILSVRNLSTSLQVEKKIVKVVDELSFDLHLGKTLALVGESGCGKTLSALSIMGILPKPPALHSTGEVIYQGKNLLTLSQREFRKIRGSKIAMIFQDPSSALNPVYPIGDQLIEVAELHLNLYGDEAFAKSVALLKDVGISSPEKRMYAYPHQLSGGMKQRVMIAMALMCEPDILIADEPTTALDATVQAQVLTLIRDLQEKKGMAVLLITHDMGVVAELADDVIVMYASQSVEKGDVVTIFDRMSHPYTMGLFHSLPREQEKGRLQPIKGQVPPLGSYPSGCKFHPRCPFVMEKCKQGAIECYSIEENTHTARCLLYDGTEESKKRGEEKR